MYPKFITQAELDQLPDTYDGEVHLACPHHRQQNHGGLPTITIDHDRFRLVHVMGCADVHVKAAARIRATESPLVQIEHPGASCSADDHARIVLYQGSVQAHGFATISGVGLRASDEDPTSEEVNFFEAARHRAFTVAKEFTFTEPVVFTNDDGARIVVCSPYVTVRDAAKLAGRNAGAQGWGTFERMLDPDDSATPESRRLYWRVARKEALSTLNKRYGGDGGTN
jgi:hypothetical protein